MVDFPLELKLMILSHADSQTLSSLALASRNWLAAVNKHDHDQLGIDVDRLSSKIFLPILRARLIRLFRRCEHQEQNALIKQHLSNATSLSTEVGLYYPFRDYEQNKAIINKAGMSIDTPRRGTMINGTMPPDEYHAAKKAKILTQACTYGNLTLFKLSLRNRLTPNADQLALAKDSQNPLLEVAFAQSKSR